MPPFLLSLMRPWSGSPVSFAFGFRWSLGRSFLPLPQSLSISFSMRRSMTSTLLMEKCLPCTGERGILSLGC